MGKIRIQEIILEDHAKRYMFIDCHGFPVLPVMKYLKWLDQTGKSPNKHTCYSLKHYFTYLEEKGKDYKVHSIRRFSSR